MSSDTLESVVVEVALTNGLDQWMDGEEILSFASAVQASFTEAPPTTLALTSAPAAYDYDYTECLGTTVDLHPGDLRLVRVPRERFEYQCGRYWSGLYMVKVITP